MKNIYKTPRPIFHKEINFLPIGQMFINYWIKISIGFMLSISSSGIDFKFELLGFSVNGYVVFKRINNS